MQKYLERETFEDERKNKRRKAATGTQRKWDGSHGCWHVDGTCVFLPKYCKSLRNSVQLICLKFSANVLQQHFVDNNPHCPSDYEDGAAFLCPVLHPVIYFLLLKSYRIVPMPIVACLMGIHVIESVYPLLVEKLGTWK